MANPISTTAAVQLPPISYPLIDPSSGGPSIAWYQTFLAFWTRSGGASGLTNTDLAASVEDALAASASAANAAAAAHVLATNALSVATSANSAATTASNTANTAEAEITALTPTVLLKVNNLNDVASLVAARSILDVVRVGLTYHIQTVGSAQSYCTPIVQNLLLTTNIANSVTFARIAPTANATFVLNFWRAGASYPVGTITLVAGSRTAAVFNTAVLNLLPGDVVELIAPITVDATLAEVGITLCALLA